MTVDLAAARALATTVRGLCDEIVRLRSEMDRLMMVMDTAADNGKVWAAPELRLAKSHLHPRVLTDEAEDD